jgi:hypothetical protein
VTLTTLDEEYVAIIRVYSGEKWCKVIHSEDEFVEWVKTARIEEVEV